MSPASAVLPRSTWTRTHAKAPAHLVKPHGLAVHWIGPAVPRSVERAERGAVANFLMAVRRHHVQSNGWSDIAYQQAVDQSGQRWELRGWDLRSAANGTEALNAKWGAVVALIGVGQHPTPDLLRGLVAARLEFMRHHPTASYLTTHGAIRPDPTACPGPDLTRWVKAGGKPPMPHTEELLSMDLSEKITIPATYPSNESRRKGTTPKPEVVTVETLLRRMYDWSYRSAFDVPPEA